MRQLSGTALIVEIFQTLMQLHSFQDMYFISGSNISLYFCFNELLSLFIFIYIFPANICVYVAISPDFLPQLV